MDYKIHIIEDQRDLSNLLKAALEKEGLKVTQSFDGQKGLHKSLRTNFSLIVLDVILPKLSGIDILKTLRDKKIFTPILMQSTRAETKSAVEGLTLGADDYITKPFKLSLFVAKIMALIRRTNGEFNCRSKYRDFILDLQSKSIHRGDQSTQLSSTEFDILNFLISKSGTTVSREEIINSVWQNRPAPSPGSIDVHINSIRKVLNKTDRHRYIETMHGQGYMLIGENR